MGVSIPQFSKYGISSEVVLTHSEVNIRFNSDPGCPWSRGQLHDFSIGDNFINSIPSVLNPKRNRMHSEPAALSHSEVSIRLSSDPGCSWNRGHHNNFSIREEFTCGTAPVQTPKWNKTIDYIPHLSTMDPVGSASLEFTGPRLPTCLADLESLKLSSSQGLVIPDPTESFLSVSSFTDRSSDKYDSSSPPSFPSWSSGDEECCTAAEPGSNGYRQKDLGTQYLNVSDMSVQSRSCSSYKVEDAVFSSLLCSDPRVYTQELVKKQRASLEQFEDAVKKARNLLHQVKSEVMQMEALVTVTRENSAMRSEAENLQWEVDMMHAEAQWSCTSCTFSNHGALPWCEQCNTRRRPISDPTPQATSHPTPQVTSESTPQATSWSGAQAASSSRAHAASGPDTQPHPRANAVVPARVAPHGAGKRPKSCPEAELDSFETDGPDGNWIVVEHSLSSLPR